jgi:hypothetical protein
VILRVSLRNLFNRKAADTYACRGFEFKLVLVGLERFGDVTGADAAGTRLDGQDAAVVFDCSDLLQIRIPYGTGFVVGMAHIVAEAGAFSTDIAFSRHIMFPPSNYCKKII